MHIEQPDANYYLKLLSPCVLVVAIANKVGQEWAAYIDAVSRGNHQEEYMQVAKRGTKLNYALAKILFPTLDKNHNWRS